MPERKVLILNPKGSPWNSFLEEFFEDSPLCRLTFVQDSAAALSALESRIPPDVIFLNAQFLSLALSQKLKVLRQSHEKLRLFHLGDLPPQNSFSLSFDAVFPKPEAMSVFQKQFVQYLPLPEAIRVLIVDDEKEIGAMIHDFLENRVAPAFRVDYTDDGKEGLELLQKQGHDVLVLDVKMPKMDGREVYRRLRSAGIKTPVIIFFDAISGDEMVEIHKSGRPAVIEKGSRHSAMPEMMNLIKKLAYFG